MPRRPRPDLTTPEAALTYLERTVTNHLRGLTPASDPNWFVVAPGSPWDTDLFTEQRLNHDATWVRCVAVATVMADLEANLAPMHIYREGGAWVHRPPRQIRPSGHDTTVAAWACLVSA